MLQGSFEANQFNSTGFTVVWTEIGCELLERWAADPGGVWRQAER
jgi:hypothetical protein